MVKTGEWKRQIDEVGSRGLSNGSRTVCAQSGHVYDKSSGDYTASGLARAGGFLSRLRGVRAPEPIMLKYVRGHEISNL